MTHDPFNGMIDDFRRHVEVLKQLALALAGMRPHISKLKEASDKVKTQEDSIRGELSKYGLVAELEKLVSVAATPLKAPEELESELFAVMEELVADMDEQVGRCQRLKEEIVAGLEAEKNRLLDKQATLTTYMSETRERLDPEEDARDDGGPMEETLAFELDLPDGEMLMKDGSEGAERRRFPRESVTLQVRVEEPNRLLSGRSEDVSVGGIFVVSPHDFELGQLLHVTCVLPSGRQTHADGVVAWLREGKGNVKPGVGIEFLALDDDDLEELERIMKAGG